MMFWYETMNERRFSTLNSFSKRLQSLLRFAIWQLRSAAILLNFPSPFACLFFFFSTNLTFTNPNFQTKFFRRCALLECWHRFFFLLFVRSAAAFGDVPFWEAAAEILTTILPSLNNTPTLAQKRATISRTYTHFGFFPRSSVHDGTGRDRE